MLNSTNKKIMLTGVIVFVIVVITFCITRSITIHKFYDKKLTQAQVASLIEESDPDNPFRIVATPEIVAKLNHIRNNPQERELMQKMLKQMKIYKPIILSELKKYDMPEDLLVIPMIESKYQKNISSAGPGAPVGLWQMTRETAKNFDLDISGKNDERKNVQASSEAALNYINTLYGMFNDWGLTLLAYNAGEGTILDLIKSTGSRDVWVIARSPSAPSQSLNYLTMFGTYVIIMHNPSLVGEEGL